MLNLAMRVFFALFVVIGFTSIANAADEECTKPSLQYVFSWPITDACNGRPRGGTSKGAEVELSQEVHAGWQQIQDPKLSKFERDRAAILAMAGGYKVDFNFLETVGYSAQFVHDRAYQSWGTEYVYVIADEPEFISLQHIMVMYFKQDDGSVFAPMVMKHWRQDWTYQDTSLLEYEHNNTWLKRALKKRVAKGTWSQAVFQVDDSPRYESYGTWIHNPSFSTWLSATTRRPLPRREYSVRKDYDVLEGFNRHTVTRTGWVQEEENWKLVLGEDGKPDSQNPYISKEQGVARYQLTANVDFTPSDEYQRNTADFWRDVRTVWNDVIMDKPSLKLLKTVDQEPLFMPLFESADGLLDTADNYDSDQGKTFIRNTIAKHLM